MGERRLKELKNAAQEENQPSINGVGIKPAIQAKTNIGKIDKDRSDFLEKSRLSNE